MRSWSKKWPAKQLILTVLMKCQEEKKEREEVIELPSSEQSQPRSQPSSQARNRADKKRLTETQRQESAVAFMTQAEVSGNGGFFQEFNKRWTCKNEHCKNKGYVCWRNVRPGQADNAAQHYKVQGPLLAKWMREVQNGDCDLDSPRPDLVLAFHKAKEKAGKRNVESYHHLHEAGGSDLRQLQQIVMGQLMINMSSQLGALLPQTGATAAATTPPAASSSEVQAAASSPIRYNVDADDLTREFFIWMRARRDQSSDKRQNLLYLAEEKVIDNGWELSALQQSAPLGKRLTEEKWKEYELPDGLLVSIRSSLPEWRIQRPRSSTPSSLGKVSVD